jgi:hypothetical protein
MLLRARRLPMCLNPPNFFRALNSLQYQVGGKPLAPSPDQGTMPVMTHLEPNISLSGTAALCHHTSFILRMLCYSKRTLPDPEHEHELSQE